MKIDDGEGLPDEETPVPEYEYSDPRFAGPRKLPSRKGALDGGLSLGGEPVDAAPFAKLFDTPDGQVLVTHEYDDGEYPEVPYRLTFRGAQHKGVDPAISFGWPTEAERDEAFASVYQERANHTARELAATVRNFMGGEVE